MTDLTERTQQGPTTPATAPAAAGGREAKLPVWVREDLVVCRGGAWDGWWFTAGDWSERRQAGERMRELHQRPTAISTYTPTPARQGHPRFADAVGTVWTAIPDQHVQQVGTAATSTITTTGTNEAAQTERDELVDADAVEEAEGDGFW